MPPRWLMPHRWPGFFFKLTTMVLAWLRCPSDAAWLGRGAPAGMGSGSALVWPGLKREGG